MSAAGYDVVESLGRAHNEIARLKARIAELEDDLRLAIDCGDHSDSCARFGVVGRVEKDCDCWKADARRVLENQ
jgi:hypothetical protein